MNTKKNTVNEAHYRSERLPVPAGFEDVLSHFYVAENGNSKSITKTLLPSFQTMLVFSFGSPVSLTTQKNTSLFIKQCLLLGPLKKSIQYTLQSGSEILVANFKGDGFYRFFGPAIDEYLMVHPDDLIAENCFAGLWHYLKEITNVQERIDFLLQFCKPYLKKQDQTLQMITSLEETPSQLDPIKTVAEQSGLTNRSIQLKHKKHLGYTAKEMNRYQRFLQALALVEQLAVGAKKPDWFEVVDICGYYDQSRLIHDFQFYLHLSPTQYLSFQQDICSSR